MADWTDTLASSLGEPSLSPQETEALLAFARDVAHGTERRHAPLSTFLVGLAVGRGQPDDRATQTVAVVERARGRLRQETEDA